MRELKQTREVLAYVYARAIPNVTEKDLKRLTGLNLSFGLVENDRVTFDRIAPMMGCLERYRQINPELRIVVSIGGWGAGGFSHACSTSEGRKAFVESGIELMLKYDLDGLDIDWEYPTCDSAGIDADPHDTERFTILLTDMKKEFDRLEKETGRHYYLSLAVPASSPSYIECAKVAPLLDYLQLMSYDMNGDWSPMSGHHTNLYPSKIDKGGFSAAQGVDKYVAAGFKKEQILLGSAFYPRCRSGFEKVENNGLYCKPLPRKPHAEGEMPRRGKRFDVGKMIETGGYDGFVRYWDEDAKAAWAFDGETFASYDDPEAVRYKMAYIRENNLMGIMFWAYGSTADDALITAMTE